MLKAVFADLKKNGLLTKPEAFFKLFEEELGEPRRLFGSFAVVYQVARCDLATCWYFVSAVGFSLDVNAGQLAPTTQALGVPSGVWAQIRTHERPDGLVL